MNCTLQAAAAAGRYAIEAGHWTRDVILNANPRALLAAGAFTLLAVGVVSESNSTHPVNGPTIQQCAQEREQVSEGQLASEAVYDPSAPCQSSGLNRDAGASFDPWPGPKEQPISPLDAFRSAYQIKTDFVDGQVTVIVHVGGFKVWGDVSRTSWGFLPLPYLSGGR